MNKNNRPRKQKKSDIERFIALRNNMPPPFKSEIIVQRKMRFRATALVDQISLGIRDLSQSVVGIVALSATTAGILAKAIKVEKVETWFNAATAGTVVESVIDWNSAAVAGTTYSPTNSVSAYSTSTAEYAHLKSIPPPGSYAAMWHDASDTTSVVSLTLPAGGILDITLSFVYNDSNAVVSGAAITGGTVGLWSHKQPDPLLVVMGNLNTIA